MEKGFLGIVLHGHLPYVRHPEHDNFFEENWLFEAITECYVPLIRVLDHLQKDRVNYRLTLSLSPTLISMLGDELLQTRYLKHLHKLIELAEKEIARTQKTQGYQELARYYHSFYLDTLKIYQDQYRRDLLTAFKFFHLTGNLKLITCAATHGFLPLLNISESAVRNQINVGVETFVQNFGFSPSGFWLPECGYYPGLEAILKNAGIEYFFSDTHGVLNASQRPVDGVYAPLDCGNGVAVFARDPDSSRQVWSSHEGYPGDYDYREYYSDIGFDLDLEYIGPYILEDNIRINTGIKYHRITGKDLPKQLYHPGRAYRKAQLHARDFVNKCQAQITSLSETIGKPPIIVSPYDAELFGHWWFEGPTWLEYVLRYASEQSSIVKTVSCDEYLQQMSSPQIAIPSASTWGDQGYSSYWINETNDWIYPMLHQAGASMEKLAIDFYEVPCDSIQERALNQAARSLLLAQSSDWPFIIKSGTTVEYAKKRVIDHLARFNYLHENIRNNGIDERSLLALEVMDNIFPEINFRDYSKNH
jgi:1,4-alpha-glucan branching enzyme